MQVPMPDEQARFNILHKKLLSLDRDVERRVLLTGVQLARVPPAWLDLAHGAHSRAEIDADSEQGSEMLAKLTASQGMEAVRFSLLMVLRSHSCDHVATDLSGAAMYKQFALAARRLPAPCIDLLCNRTPRESYIEGLHVVSNSVQRVSKQL